MPTRSTQAPVPSFMAHVVITLSTVSTVRADSARSPLVGLTPPLASVAAIIATSRQSTLTEH